jgi:hypothetical protein
MRHEFDDFDDNDFDEHDAIGVACAIALAVTFILLYIGEIP